jgi:hypothetical protein
MNEDCQLKKRITVDLVNGEILGVVRGKTVPFNCLTHVCRLINDLGAGCNHWGKP